MSIYTCRQAIILAGGLGTRLRAIVSDRPKPMVTIGERPVVEYQIEYLRDAGIEEVILAVGYMADAIEEHFGDGRRFEVRVCYAHERELLGTAGAIRNAASFLGDDPFLVLNGDTLMPQLNYADMVGTHAGATATLVVVRPPDAGAYGVLDLDASGARILGFREKAPVDPQTAWISGGIYVLEPKVLDWIETGRPVSIETEVFPALLRDGCELRTHHYDGFFGDMGTPEGLERVRQYIVGASR